MNVKNKLLKKIKGFTLVEIMIVVTIIGILASLAVPAFQRARWKALETSVRNNLRQIWGAAQQYMLENGVDSVELAQIVTWQPKQGNSEGAATNPGYTSVIKQIAGEDYNAIWVYVDGETFNDIAGEKVSAGDDVEIKISTFKTNTIGLQVTDSGSGNFIKLRI